MPTEPRYRPPAPRNPVRASTFSFRAWALFLRRFRTARLRLQLPRAPRPVRLPRISEGCPQRFHSLVWPPDWRARTRSYCKYPRASRREKTRWGSQDPIPPQCRRQFRSVRDKRPGGRPARNACARDVLVPPNGSGPAFLVLDNRVALSERHRRFATNRTRNAVQSCNNRAVERYWTIYPTSSGHYLLET